METILNDAFNPSAYTNFIPIQKIEKDQQIVKTILISLTIIVVAVSIYQVYKKKSIDEKNME